MNRTASALLVLASLGLAACGSSSSSSDSASTKPATETTTPAVVTTKPATPTTKAASPTTKPATPTTKAGTPTTKAATPTTKPGAAATPAASGTAADETVDLREVGSLGSVLVDGAGKTLYRYTKDAAKQPGTCTGACATAWPPVIVTTTPKAGAGVEAAELGTVKLSDGKLQATYHGWPLYHYSEDTTAGEAKGQKLDNAWYAVDATGATVTK